MKDLGTNVLVLFLLIAHYAKYSGCDSVITFDKRAAKLELFELLKRA